MNKNLKKFLKLSTFAFLLTMSLNSNVFAYENTYYTNSNRISFTEEQYTNFTKLGFTNEQIDDMDKKFYDSYGDMDYVEKDKTVTKYFRETTLSNNTTYVEEITQKDYLNETPSLNLVLSRASTHETNYKKITLSSYQISTAFPNKRHVISNLEWKLLPSVKSYDIYAARVNGGFIYSDTMYGTMTATATKFDSDCIPITTTNYTDTYPSTSGAWNTANELLGYSGVGFTSELKKVPYICINDTGMHNALVSGYSASLSFQSDVGTTVYASYQHAQKSVSYNSVYRAYSFRSTGLGGVIYFSNSSLRDSYDGMGGVSLTL